MEKKSHIQRKKTTSKLKKKNTKLKSISPKKRCVVAPKRANVSSVIDTERQQYTFTLTKSDVLAVYDEAGGAIEVILPGFIDYFDETKPANWENIARELLIGVLIHEDIHRGISDTDIKTTMFQDHDIMYELFRPDKS